MLGGFSLMTQVASQRDHLMEIASSRDGIPYRIDPPPDGVNNLDCSLFVLLTLQDAGLSLPIGVRTAEQIRQATDAIDLDSVEKGDLLFFEHTYEPDEPAGPDGHIASHIGFSLGQGTLRMWDCHASSGDSGPPGVGQTDISTQYWQSKLFDARRPRGLASDLDTSPQPPQTATVFLLTTDGVRMRAQPGTSADIVVQNLGAGATVTQLSSQTVDADGDTWRNVKTTDGQVGWVSAEFLQSPAAVGDNLTDDADHVFGFAALWPTIQVAAGRFGSDPQVDAAIVQQESGFTNFRVHRDGTGHGLIGLDDNGLLPDFEQWSGLSVGRGATAISIPPKLQIEYLSKAIAAYTLQYGSAMIAARVWHRGPGLWQDSLGQQYEDLIRAHIQSLFGSS